MQFTNYAEDNIINHFLDRSDFTSPASLFVSLHTADPGEAGSYGDEVGNGEYARQAVTFGASSGGVKSNTAQLNWATSVTAWGNITHIAVGDSLTGGNMLAYGALNSAKDINAGGLDFFIKAGELILTFAGDYTTNCLNLIMDHVFGKGTANYVRKSLVVGIYSADPNVPANEISYTGYLRQAITFNAPSDGVADNFGDIDFVELPASTPTKTITHYGISNSDNDLLFLDTVDPNETADELQTPRILDGTLEVQVR